MFVVYSFNLLNEREYVSASVPMSTGAGRSFHGGGASVAFARPKREYW